MSLGIYINSQFIYSSKSRSLSCAFLIFYIYINFSVLYIPINYKWLYLIFLLSSILKITLLTPLSFSCNFTFLLNIFTLAFIKKFFFRHVVVNYSNLPQTVQLRRSYIMFIGLREPRVL